ncbi:MAG: peptidoglycan editing factor PgeF [Pseudomonas sp.]|jgi:YfiH family protein|nr:peptidoglycan editing factor PgeF [Pseudomonas sp.]MDY0413883.1 peptidoglycan editing factor PgeF [Pseudomonas sp.]NLO53013.1 peptidoglycan editing factor PgeF [Gammaproteobacteria bacterium]
MEWPFDWLTPDWPAPQHVRACVTTCSAGGSVEPFAAFNLGDHVGDSPAQVQANRQYLVDALGCQPSWLNQVHSDRVVIADAEQILSADASVTRELGLACCIMSADCLPVLFTDQVGSCVAAAHAGWRSLAAGILENTVASMQVAPQQLMAWLGPAIGAAVFEVGGEVRNAFIQNNPSAAQAFVSSYNDGRWLADIYQLARIRLAACGVTAVYGGGLCTVTDSRFYSYRRQAVTGRFASLVWMTE